MRRCAKDCDCYRVKDEISGRDISPQRALVLLWRRCQLHPSICVWDVVSSSSSISIYLCSSCRRNIKKKEKKKRKKNEKTYTVVCKALDCRRGHHNSSSSFQSLVHGDVGHHSTFSSFPTRINDACITRIYSTNIDTTCQITASLPPMGPPNHYPVSNNTCLICHLAQSYILYNCRLGLEVYSHEIRYLLVEALWVEAYGE